MELAHLTDRAWYALKEYELFPTRESIPRPLRYMRAPDMEYWVIPMVEDRPRERAVPCGYVLRKLVDKGGGGPKSLTYLTHRPMGGRYYPRAITPVDDNKILLVEDPMSAIAARNHGVNAYCLLGTRIPSGLRDELHRLLARPEVTVTLALDADATQDAIRMKRRWFNMSNFKLLRLDEDIKNMNATKRIELLAGL